MHLAVAPEVPKATLVMTFVNPVKDEVACDFQTPDWQIYWFGVTTTLPSVLVGLVWVQNPNWYDPAGKINVHEAEAVEFICVVPLNPQSLLFKKTPAPAVFDIESEMRDAVTIDFFARFSE